EPVLSPGLLEEQAQGFLREERVRHGSPPSSRGRRHGGRYPEGRKEGGKGAMGIASRDLRCGTGGDGRSRGGGASPPGWTGGREGGRSGGGFSPAGRHQPHLEPFAQSVRMVGGDDRRAIREPAAQEMEKTCGEGGHLSPARP